MDNKNLIAAVVISIGILIGFQYLYVKPQQEHYRQQAQAEKMAAQIKAERPPENDVLRERDLILGEKTRVRIKTPELDGSIDLKGARIDDLSLVRYRVTLEPDSPEITLLSPAGALPPHNAYYAELSWLGADASTAVPTAQTLWKAEGRDLSPAAPLKLSWDNGQGLLFERLIAVDEHFMFTVTDSVRNNGGAAVTLYPFGFIRRQGKPATSDIFVLHEGPIGVLGGTLKEYKYSGLVDDGKKTESSEGGWLGITDKYWLTALVPPQDEKISAGFTYTAKTGGGKDQGIFQTDFRGGPVTVASGASAQHVTRLFAGAKRLNLLDQYGEQFKIPLFDHAIDFGWFDFLTKPFLYLLDFLGRWLGNFGLAILVFTVMLKIVTLPLSVKSYRAMAKMKALQPEMKRLQERFADDKMRQSVEMMDLYKREKVSPASGCLPTLIQIPIFFALYKVLYVGIEMRQAPFYGWIKDLSMPDPTSVFNLFGMIPVTLPAALHLGVWPLLMGVSMFLQQKLSPQPPDKMQARLFMLMPVVFTFMLAQMPAGLVIYWTWSNLLSILQQWFIMRHAGDPRR
ncbi:MAG: membrane protein insertase YidC [Bdellovibrionales bacterium]